MSKYKQYTLIFIGLMLVLGIGYDVWVIIVGGRENSISWTLIELSYQHPIIPFLTGYLCGHLFWNMKDPKESK